jgi:serine/threonine protein kinase
MSRDAVIGFVREIGQYRLLEPSQQEELARNMQARFDDPRSLFRELIERNWLTPYQANHILTGRGSALVLGPYLLLDRITETAMGELLRARHQHMRRMVALQVVRPDLLHNAEAVQRFYQEIQAAGQLSHPNVVSAYDAGPIGPTHFFAMEYVEGVDLEELVQETGPLPVEQACDYTYQAALGLQHAHERGLLHHDLRPANLLIAARHPGPLRLRLLQAGKKRTALGAGALVKIANLGLTLICQHKRRTKFQGSLAGDQFIGTPDFIAPELGREGRQPDYRSQLYSLGCCLYYQLAGRVPFPGGSGADKLRRHQLEDPAPLETLRQDVPSEATAILRMLLAKRPEDRLGTPGELAAALAPLIPTTAGPPPAGPAAAEADLGGADRPRPDTGNGLPSTPRLELPSAVLLDRVQSPRLPASWGWLLLNLGGAALLLGSLGTFLYLLFLQTSSPAGSGPRESGAWTGPVNPDDRPRPRNGKHFDGLAHFLDEPHRPALDPLDITVEAWVKIAEFPDGEEKRRWLVSKNLDERTEGFYALLISGGQVGAFLNIKGERLDVWTDDVLAVEQWHHLAMTCDGASLIVYCDGAALAERAVKRPRVPGRGPLVIARGQTQSSDGERKITVHHFFKGWLDDIRIYNQALPPEEIKSHFEQPAVSSSPLEKDRRLVRYWRF